VSTERAKQRFRPSDVFQIALPNGKYAYGRVYRDASVGIYKQLSDDPNTPPIGSRDFMFFVGMYEDILTSGKVPIVGRDRFENEEAAWPPPYSVKDSITGAYRLYHKGKMRPSSKEEAGHLEPAAVWDLHHITDRIMAETRDQPGQRGR
jgi:immunity protein 26 of polymorphic toxin system